MPLFTSASFDPENFSATKAKLLSALKRVANDLAKELHDTAPERKHPQPGPYARKTKVRTRDSFKVRVRGDTIEVYSTAPHLEALTEGAGPTLIFPSQGKALAFKVGDFKLRNSAGFRTITPRAGSKAAGATTDKLAVKYVIHPGHKANPFVQKAVSKLPKNLRRVLRGLK